MVHLGEVGPTIWDEIMDELEKKLDEVEFRKCKLVPDWRKLAHRRKFEREAFAKYGYFKDFVLHPKVQLVKHYVEENARLDDIMLGEPFTSVTNIVILSFMLYRRLDNFIVTLIAAFLLNLNPIYVSMICIVMFLTRKGRSPKGYISRKKVTVPETITVSLKKSPSFKAAEFDHVLIGYDVSTYFTAAILSRCGHKCIVIEPTDCPSYQVQSDNVSSPVSIIPAFVSKVERYQPLLDAVQSMDPKQRVVFAPLGTAENGFTNAIVRLIAPSQSLKNSLGQISQRKGYISTLYSRPGEHALVHYLCSTLSIEKSRLLGAFDRIRSLWQFLTGFLYSRCTLESDWSKSPLSSNPFAKQFQHIVTSSLDQYLLNCDIPEGKVHDALHALACTIGAQEAVPRNELSAFAFGMVSQFAESGAFAPVGGIPALMRIFKNEIYSIGGMTLTDVDSIKLEVSNLPAKATSTTASNSASYKVTGVAVSSEGHEEILINGQRSVISGLGVLSSYAGLLSSDILSETTKRKLESLEETKPKLKVVFCLKGTSSDLGITNTDFYQVIIKQPVQNLQEEIISSKRQAIGEYCHVWSPSMHDPSWQHSDSQVLVVELDLTPHFVSKAEMELMDGSKGPMFYTDNRNGETNPNDPMFAEKLCRRLKLSKSKEGEFIRAAEGIVQQLYPKITSRHFISTHLETPVLGGYKLANTAAKYAACLSAHTEIQNFYLTGSDLAGIGLTGDLQSGVVTANAVLGYTAAELGEGRNAIQDMI